MNPLLQAAIGSIIRALLASAGGFFVQRGWWTQGEATDYIAGLTLVLLSLGWSLWQKYGARIKFLTALESPAGTTEAKVDAKIEIGKGASILPMILVVVFVGGSVGCALKDARHQAVVGSSVLYTAIAAVDDTELALSQAGAITSAQHAQLNPKVLTLLRAGQAANSAIIVWQPGEPTPAALQTAVTELGKVATAVIAILPDSPAKASLQTKILLAQQAALLLLAFGPLIGGV